jgi:hypothetical protein
MGIRLIFHPKPIDAMQDGTVFIKFHRNCFVKAIPYREGEIVAFAPIQARELIAIGTASFFTPPEKQALETATVAPVENAALPPAKPAAKKTARK